MKKGIYFMLLAMVVLYTSCKKKEEAPPTYPPASDAVVKSVSQTPSGESHTYSYDSQGRLERIQSWNGTSTTISYSGDTVTETNYNDSAQIISFNVLFLNSSGLATSSFLRDTSGNLFSRSTYMYDTANFRISEKTYDALNTEISHEEWNVEGYDVYYYSLTDNLNSQNNAQFGYAYSYESDNTTGNENTGLKYYGKSSQHVMKTLTKFGFAYYTFQYTFDDLKRISTQRAYNHQGELLYTNTYTYN